MAGIQLQDPNQSQIGDALTQELLARALGGQVRHPTQGFAQLAAAFVAKRRMDEEKGRRQEQIAALGKALSGIDPDSDPLAQQQALENALLANPSTAGSALEMRIARLGTMADRFFRREEREAGQEFQATENQLGRQFQADQGEVGREFQAGQNALSRALTREEGAAGRAVTREGQRLSADAAAERARIAQLRADTLAAKEERESAKQDEGTTAMQNFKFLVNEQGVAPEEAISRAFGDDVSFAYDPITRGGVVFDRSSKRVLGNLEADDRGGVQFIETTPDRPIGERVREKLLKQQGG